jgi:hypothetical protein
MVEEEEPKGPAASTSSEPAAKARGRVWFKKSRRALYASNLPFFWLQRTARLFLRLQNTFVEAQNPRLVGQPRGGDFSVHSSQILRILEDEVRAFTSAEWSDTASPALHTALLSAERPAPNFLSNNLAPRNDVKKYATNLSHYSLTSPPTPSPQHQPYNPY